MFLFAGFYWMNNKNEDNSFSFYRHVSVLLHQHNTSWQSCLAETKGLGHDEVLCDDELRRRMMIATTNDVYDDE